MRPMLRPLIVSLLFAASAPAVAQGGGLVEDFSQRLGDAANDRLRANRETRQQLVDGWCESRLKRLTSLHDAVERAQAQLGEADLAAYRQALAQEWAYPCPPGGPPTPPQPPQLAAPFERTAAYRQWEQVYSAIATDLYAAERDGRSGNCQGRANGLRDAARRIGEIEAELARQGPAFGQRFGGAGLDLYRGRLQAELGRACPPGAPTPSPVPQVALQPTPPAQGLTQADAEAVALQQSSLDSSERERREAQEKRARRAVALLTAAYLVALIPRVGIGVRRDGAPGVAPERDAGQTRRRVNGFGISAGLQTKIRPDFDLRVGMGYAEGDASTSFTSPATSTAQRVDTGIVYGRLSNGSSGIIAGGGGSGEARSTLSAAEVYAELSGFKVDVGAASFEFSAGIDYTRLQTRHDASIASAVLSGGTTFTFGQTRAQALDEDYVGVLGGIAFDVPVTGTTDGGLTFSGSVRVGLYRRSTSFRGTERDTASFGPVGNRDLTLTFADKQSAWGGRIKASAALEYPFGPVTLGIGGGVDYRSDVGAIVNPNSGDQVLFEGKTTRLETSDLLSWNAGVRLRIPF